MFRTCLVSFVFLLACGAKSSSPASPAPPADAPVTDRGPEPPTPAEPIAPADPAPAPTNACGPDRARFVHGCGGPAFAEGCQQLCGAGHAACPAGTTCTTTTYNPCVPGPDEDPRNARCAACGAEVQLCL
ncbi:MAG: hypothetical protein K8W52_05730 [Deltaproteobacteria bacterium]|nr:hypothetical protein [Deltaproteobacteria bacterium]